MIFRESKCLCGEWEFFPEGRREKKFLIHVPSLWTHGKSFGYPEEWERMELAIYKKTVKLPEFNEKQLLCFRFNAVMLKCSVYLNGEKIGEHSGGFTPFLIYVPPKLWKENSGKYINLELKVESALSAVTHEGIIHQIGYPEDSEEGSLPGGIWQEVLLSLKPITHVSSWHCVFKYKERRVKLFVILHNEDLSIFYGTLSLTISGLQAPSFEMTSKIDIPAKSKKQFVFEFPLPQEFRLWSYTKPFLYNIRISLCKDNFQEIDIYEDKIGFREFRISGKECILNGKNVRMLGLSLIRHRVAPYLWREDYLRLYFNELKKIGFNTLRLHAAIAPEIVLRIADELGIMILNQSSIWSTAQAGYRKGGNTFLQNTKREFREWFERDKNHPSLIMWDVENEQVRIDKKNIPWVNELLDFMRTLTGSYVYASASGTASKSDVIHLHCEENMYKLTEKPQNRPVLLGEWWGPGKEYNRKMHVQSRKIDNVFSMEDIEKMIGEFYKSEIIRQRIRDVNGTFPFAVELFLFRPIFKDMEPLKYVSKKFFPHIKYAEMYPGYNYHTPRRPLVNPGWSREKPEVIYAKHVREKFKEALSPIIIGLLEENCDLYAEKRYNRTVILVNDSGCCLSGILEIKFSLTNKNNKVIFLKRFNIHDLETGKNMKFNVTLCVPKVSEICPARLTLLFKENNSDSGNIKYMSDYRIWPANIGEIKTDILVYTMGVDKRILKFLSDINIKFEETSKFPDKKAILIIGAFPSSISAEEYFNFMKKGGRIFLLRQNKIPKFIPLPFSFYKAAKPYSHVLEGIIDTENELNFVTEVPVLFCEHKILSSFPKKVIGPFAEGDFRVLDDAYLRPSLSGVSDPGKCKILVQGANRSQVGMAEINCYRGTVILSQIIFENNLGIDPQADKIFFDTINYLAAFTPSANKTVYCDCMGYIGKISGKSQNELFIQSVKDSDIAFLFSYKNIMDILRKLQGENIENDNISILYEKLCHGATVIVFSYELAGENDELLPGLSIVPFDKKNKNNIIVNIKNQHNMIFYWNSCDIENSLYDIQPDSLFYISEKNREIFDTSADVFFHSYDTPYGGASIGEYLGSLLVSMQVNKGMLVFISLPLDIQFSQALNVLRNQMFAYLGILHSEAPVINKTVVIAKKTPDMPLDGDINKWYNREADPNISNWKYANPILIDLTGIVRDSCMNMAQPCLNSHAAICAFMYNKEKIFFSSFVVSNEFCFSEIETLLWERDSIQIFTENSQILVSSDENGKLFVETKGIEDRLKNRILGNVCFYDDIFVCPEISNVKINSAEQLSAMFIELCFPREIFFSDNKCSKRKIAIALNIANPIRKKRFAQFGFPANFSWTDISSYTDFILE